MDKSHTVHNLKTWPDEFQAVGEETKRFEFRRNDRDFKVEDFLCSCLSTSLTPTITPERC